MTSENRQRQCDELLLISSMFPAEFSWIEAPLDLSEPLTHDPGFLIAIDSSYTLEFSLPESYPTESPPSVVLRCAGEVDTATRKRAREELRKIVGDVEVGTESVDLIITGFQAVVPTLSTPLDERPPSTITTDEKKVEQKIKRVVIWSHHLLATSKRRAIVSWSKELLLGGFSRPGYPGCVFVEGGEEEVDEFVARLKELRWQALQVRGEMVVEGGRLLGDGTGGVEEVEGLGAIAAGLKALGEEGRECEEMFLTGMKIGRSD